MNLSSLGGYFDLNSIESSPFMSSLQSMTTPSADSLSKISSMPLENIFWIVGGLMLFRMFGGMIFSVLSLLGLIGSTLTSVVCSILSVFVKIFGSTSISFVNLFGTTAKLILNSPIKLLSSLISRWGQILIPVAASCIMSTMYFQQNLFTSWISKLTQKGWVAIEAPAKSESFERF